MRHVCATTVWFAALSLAADGLPHVEGTLSVPSVISDDMVLPAHPRHAVLWGWGRPHSPVSVAVTGPGLREQGNTTAGASGAWRVGLPPLSPSLAPNVITVTSPGETPLVFRRVLVGDLVLCGGQSNMQFSLNLAFNGSDFIAAAGNYSDRMRLLTVARVMASTPASDAKLTQSWTPASPAAVDDGQPFGVFSAECFLTGRRLLNLRPGVPLGLISSCWSGSMIQPWMSAAALGECPDAHAHGPDAPFSDSQMFNAMIAPLLPLQPAAVLWHQGEENAGNPVEYRCFFRALIQDWRRQFSLPALPFNFVQLQPCGIPPAQRYAQAAALGLPGVAMATAVDLLDPGAPGTQPCPGFNQSASCANPYGMCHTRWKDEIAQRLAAVTAHALFNGTTLARLSASGRLPALTPRVTGVVSTAKTDYRDYTVVLSVADADGVDDIAIGGTKECTLCCNTPGFALEYQSTAPGLHWQALGTKPGKHGVPLVYNATARQLTLRLTIEPPFDPAGLRHAWLDAPQCMLFAEPGHRPLAPFNISVEAAAFVSAGNARHT